MQVLRRRGVLGRCGRGWCIWGVGADWRGWRWPLRRVPTCVVVVVVVVVVVTDGVHPRAHRVLCVCRYWTLASEQPDTWTGVPSPLPSDSRFRQDLALLAKGDLKGSQHWKESLENLQRKDKKLRPDYH